MQSSERWVFAFVIAVTVLTLGTIIYFNNSRSDAPSGDGVVEPQGENAPSPDGLATDDVSVANDAPANAPDEAPHNAPDSAFDEPQTTPSQVDDATTEQPRPVEPDASLRIQVVFDHAGTGADRPRAVFVYALSASAFAGARPSVYHAPRRYPFDTDVVTIEVPVPTTEPTLLFVGARGLTGVVGWASVGDGGQPALRVFGDAPAGVDPALASGWLSLLLERGRVFRYISPDAVDGEAIVATLRPAGTLAVSAETATGDAMPTPACTVTLSEQGADGPRMRFSVDGPALERGEIVVPTDWQFEVQPLRYERYVWLRVELEPALPQPALLPGEHREIVLEAECRRTHLRVVDANGNLIPSATVRVEARYSRRRGHLYAATMNPSTETWCVVGGANDQRLAVSDPAHGLVVVPWKDATPTDPYVVELAPELADAVRVKVHWGDGYAPTGRELAELVMGPCEDDGDFAIGMEIGTVSIPASGEFEIALPVGFVVSVRPMADRQNFSPRYDQTHMPGSLLEFTATAQHTLELTVLDAHGQPTDLACDVRLTKTRTLDGRVVAEPVDVRPVREPAWPQAIELDAEGFEYRIVVIASDGSSSATVFEHLNLTTPVTLQLETARPYVEYHVSSSLTSDVDTIVLVTGARPAPQQAWPMRARFGPLLDLFDAFKVGNWAAANRLIEIAARTVDGRLKLPVRFERTWLPEEMQRDRWWAIVPQRGVFPATIDTVRGTIVVERPLEYGELTVQIEGPWPASPRLLLVVSEVGKDGPGTAPWEYRLYPDDDRFFTLYLPPGQYELAIAKDRTSRHRARLRDVGPTVVVDVGASGGHARLDTPDRDW